MAGSVAVYSMGEHGVNVSNDARHTDTGDVRTAQNVTFYGGGRKGGLAKRLGMVAINTSALDGALVSLAHETFEEP